MHSQIDFPTLAEYRAHLYELLRKPLEQAAATNKFTFVNRGARPNHYPGVTMIAKPFLTAAENSGRWLLEVSQQLERHIVGFVPVCKEHSHLTVVDVEAGDDFTSHLGAGVGALESFATSLADAEFPVSGGGVKLRIAGITMFPRGQVIALCDLDNEDAYRQVLKVRRAVMTVAAAHDVAPPRHPFLAHLTLGYLAAALPASALAPVLAPYRLLRATSLRFAVASCALFGFSDMLRFHEIGPAVRL